MGSAPHHPHRQGLLAGLVGGGLAFSPTMCIHLWRLVQIHHYTSIVVTNQSESWRLWMSIPACSPRLFQPLPLPRRPLAQNSPCHELCHVQIAFDLFDLRVGCFSLAAAVS